MSLNVSLSVSVDTGSGTLHWFEVFDANVTHNLGKMASEAGIYKHIWHPDELGITTAGELVQPLLAGLKLMREEPDRFLALNPPNGWGSYENFVPWIQRYLTACEEHPKATIRASG